MYLPVVYQHADYAFNGLQLICAIAWKILVVPIINVISI